MTTLEIIYETADAQPEKRAILDKVKVEFHGIKNQYHNCGLMQKIIEVKFDMNVFESGGYSLNEILNAVSSEGIRADEVRRFVLEKLQEFIRSRQRK